MTKLESFSPARLIRHLNVPLFRNAYALIFNSATTSVLGIAYWVLAARFYETDVVGRNSAAIAATILLSSIAALYLDGALLRFIPPAGSKTGRLILGTYLISTTAAAAITLAFLAGIQFWSPALGFLTSSTWSQIWFLLATVTGTVFFLQDGALTGLRKAVWVPVENLAFAIAKLLLLVVFAGSFPEYGIFASWTIPAAILILPVNYLIFRRLIGRHEAETAEVARPIVPRQIAHYVAGNYVGLLFLLGYTKLLPLMVFQEAGSKASAFFYLPWIIATSLQLVAQNMSVSLVVEGTIDESRLRKYVRSSLVHTLLILTPVSVFLALFAPLVLSVYGQAYAQEASGLLRLLALAVLPNAVCVLFIGLSRVERRIRRVVSVQATLAVAVLGLSYFLLPIYGITGIGIAWLTSQTVIAGVLLATTLRPIITGREVSPVQPTSSPAD